MESIHKERPRQKITESHRVDTVKLARHVKLAHEKSQHLAGCIVLKSGRIRFRKNYLFFAFLMARCSRDFWRPAAFL